MECFKHPSKISVGLCRGCGKSICRDCATEFPKGIACSEECIKEATETIELNDRAKKLYGIGQYKSNRLSTQVLVWLLLSLVMWLTVLLTCISKGTPDPPSLASAIIFSMISFIVHRSSKRSGLQI